MSHLRERERERERERAEMLLKSVWFYYLSLRPDRTPTDELSEPLLDYILPVVRTDKKVTQTHRCTHGKLLHHSSHSVRHRENKIMPCDSLFEKLSDADARNSCRLRVNFMWSETYTYTCIHTRTLCYE